MKKLILAAGLFALLPVAAVHAEIGHMAAGAGIVADSAGLLWLAKTKCKTIRGQVVCVQNGKVVTTDVPTGKKKKKNTDSASKGGTTSTGQGSGSAPESQTSGTVKTNIGGVARVVY